MRTEIGRRLSVEDELNDEGMLDMTSILPDIQLDKEQAAQLVYHITKVFMTDEIKKEIAADEQKEEKDDV